MMIITESVVCVNHEQQRISSKIWQNQTFRVVIIWVLGFQIPKVG